MRFQDIKIKTKLSCGFLCVVMIFSAVAVYQIVNLRTLGALQHEGAARALDALAIKDVAADIASLSAILDEALVHREVQKAKNGFQAFKENARKDMDRVKGLADTDQEKQLAAQFIGSYTAFLNKIEQELFPLTAKREEALKQGGTADMSSTAELDKNIQDLDEAIDREMAACMKPLAQMIQYQVDENTESDRQFDSISSRSTEITIAVCVIGMLLALLIAYFSIRIITVPLEKAVELAGAVAAGDLQKTLDLDQKDEIGVLAGAMRKMIDNLRGLAQIAQNIARGDLTVKVKPLSDKDILGHALRDMVEKLSEAMAEINTSAANVAAGSEQMNSTSQAMSQGATEQASSLEEISSSMNEISSQTRQNAENSSLANKLAGDTKILAVKGNDQMNRMVAAMNEINDSSRSISKIIKVIDEIAFQTNLLALNAAVEAARAGKHGKGFAVVAEEVRTLAARSAKAAKETADLIEGSVRKVEDGTEMANKTEDALKEIVAAAAKMTDLVGEIAAASNEQAQGVSQITSGLGQIDQVTQQNTAHAEESASAAEELSSQSLVLQQLVSTFKVNNKTLLSVPQADTGLQKMLLSGSRKTVTGMQPWGGDSAGNHAPEPVIHLNDREFGKY